VGEGFKDGLGTSEKTAVSLSKTEPRIFSRPDRSPLTILTK